jgi:hypothetical protein
MPQGLPKFEDTTEVKDALPAFDDTKELKPSIAAETSALAGLGQGASFGFADEIAGLGGATKDALTGKGFEYKKKRDEWRKWFDEAKKTNPKSYLAGELGGSVGTALIPGVGIAGNLGKASLVTKGALTGAGIGALSGLGQSEAEKPLDMALDVRNSALLGGGLGAAGGLVAKGASSLAKKLPEIAEQRAFKAATGQNKKAFKDAFKTDSLETKGRDLLTKDEAGSPVVGWFSRSEDIAEKAGKKSDFFGKQIGKIGEQIDQVSPNAIDGKKVANQILEYTSNIADTPKNESIIKNLLKEAEFYQNKGNFSFSDAQKFKGSYKFKPTDTTTQVLGQDATNAVRGIVSKEMETTAEGLASQNPNTKLADLLGKYKEVKQKYGSFETAQKAAEERSLANLSNRFVSPSDYGIGAAAGLGTAAATGGAAIPSMLLAGGGALANKLARERGSAFAARSANLADRTLQLPLVEKLKALLEKYPNLAGYLSGKNSSKVNMLNPAYGGDSPGQ